MATAAKSKIVNLREHILGLSDVPEEPVHVTGWDRADGAECWILVRGLNGSDRAKFQKAFTKQQGNQMVLDWDRYWSDLVILCACDPDTKERIFTMTDRDSLLLRNAANLEKVAEVARRLSGLDDNAMASAKSGDHED